MVHSSRTDNLNAAENSQDATPVRERIVQAALELAQTIGVQGMSQARVAAAAGVRQSHLTYYFPTRADLIKATVYAIRDQMLDATRNALQPTDDIRDPVAALRAYCLREVCNASKARLVLSLMVVAEEEPSMNEWNDAFHQEDIGVWLTVYRQLGVNPPAEEIELFHTTYVGATLLAARSGTEAAMERAQRVMGLAFDRLLISGGYQLEQEKSQP